MEKFEYTHRTRDGRKARIIGRVNNENYPVVAAILNGHKEVVANLTEKLTFALNIECKEDLVSEITPYEDWPIDSKVLVWSGGGKKLKRHFAGVSANGKPTAFMDGNTSFTTECVREWDYAELFEE